MSAISITATVDLVDIWEDISDAELIAEVEARELEISVPAKDSTLELIYEEFRRRGDAPQILRDFLYEHTGRTL